MQLARAARDDSPDRKSANLKSAGRKKGRKRVESSDDEDSASEKETSRLYPASIRITRAHEQVKAGREAQLLSGYLDSKQGKPVHCRRTLDQFSYYMLNSTEARDKSQVAYRWAKNPTVCTEPKNRPIVMVDQLWMWAFHDGTLVTSSPNTWNGQEEFNLSNVIVKELRYNKDRPIIKSMEDLLHLILKTSVDFFKRKGPVGFQFHECFQSSINNVSEQQGHLFDNFRRTTKRLHVGKLDPVERKKEIEFLFSLDDETELLVEIMDIQDELTIVKTILTQQQVVLERLLRLYPKKVDDEDAEGQSSTAPSGLGKNEMMVLQSLVQLLKDQGSPGTTAKTVLPKPTLKENVGETPSIVVSGDQVQQDKDVGLLDQKSLKPRGKGKEKEGEGGVSTVTAKQPAPTPKANILQNRDLMYETIGIVENNIRLVQDMLAYAEKLENLLDLKQKHANGWEARFAREGSEESQRQGNIILVFTLVTVVFLPLSFITSFLALGLDIFPRDEGGELNLPTLSTVGWLCTSPKIPLIAVITNHLPSWNLRRHLHPAHLPRPLRKQAHPPSETNLQADAQSPQRPRYPPRPRPPRRHRRPRLRRRAHLCRPPHQPRQIRSLRPRRHQQILLSRQLRRRRPRIRPPLRPLPLPPTYPLPPKPLALPKIPPRQRQAKR
ncbi:hypothetical protein B0T14DRAFT_436163 [Immersiella caudata]|uniref:Uncharacterized protein n=1 Tax=Immersiella caudata TaxID=314043 RepID=A0AA39WFV9_9PEZI|nr:hypothetical protein B0T14DRAFT_436163 [Immersiella caudata]